MLDLKFPADMPFKQTMILACINFSRMKCQP